MRRLFVIACALVPLGVYAQDLERGKALYETYCGGQCHVERLHDRRNSKVASLADLRDMVARWAPQTRYPFTLDELEDVVQHLNATHYRLKPRPPRAGAGS